MTKAVQSMFFFISTLLVVGLRVPVHGDDDARVEVDAATASQVLKAPSLGQEGGAATSQGRTVMRRQRRAGATDALRCDVGGATRLAATRVVCPSRARVRVLGSSASSSLSASSLRPLSPNGFDAISAAAAVAASSMELAGASAISDGGGDGVRCAEGAASSAACSEPGGLKALAASASDNDSSSEDEDRPPWRAP